MLRTITQREYYGALAHLESAPDYQRKTDHDTVLHSASQQPAKLVRVITPEIGGRHQPDLFYIREEETPA